ncbi:MFS transporter [Desulfonatronum thioautotrophicum]|uniref:MFS transporter n=1 Tax=Desulfonatronum thioautotrophicum TaxID=617001 RepID=UPI000B2FB5DA|nr:MFS transporter [Desulfonatronum thioautotrophicum]
MSTTHSHPSPVGPDAGDVPKYTFLSMIGVNMMVFMATLDMSIVNVALPSLARQLDTDFATVQWVILSYVLVVASLLLLVSRLGDMRGKKGIFSLGLGLFTLGSLLCGLAPSVGWLIFFRAVQGIGAAMSQALGIAIVTEIAPPGRRGRAIGLIGATVAMGLALGPSLGGVIIEYIGWRWIFWINVPVGILAQLIIARYMPALPPRRGGQRFDIPGAVLAAVTLAAYSMGMTMGQKVGFAAPLSLALLGTALLGLAGFIHVERRSPDPMIDLKLFANPLFSINLIMSVLVFISLSAGFIMPFFLQFAQDRPPSEVGLMMMAIPLSMGLVAPFAGALSDRFGPRGLSLLGLVILITGCLAVSTLNLDTPWWGFVLRVIPVGLGVGLFQAPNNSAIMGAVPQERLGVASGLLNYSRVFGQSTGLPLIGTIFTLFVVSVTLEPVRTDFAAVSAEALAAGIAGAYRFQAGLLLAAAALGIAAWIIDHRNTQSKIGHDERV